jgi:predicted nucleic acid-binding protein
MDAFDADVLIYAAAPGHPLAGRVRRLLAAPNEPRIGSTLLLPEVLIKPQRTASAAEHAELVALLSRLELRPCDAATAAVAVDLGTRYNLRAADAVHLATAVSAGADRFITNNRRDFDAAISEIDIVYPEELADGA